MMTLSEAARVTQGERYGADPEFMAVGIDTRALEPGALFVAIAGTRFDGHDFLPEAAERGAVAALLARPAIWDHPQLVVPDTRLGLSQLAKAWRARFDVPVIGVTGSNGKTTVKEMLAAMLGVADEGLVTRGNLNNDLGVPLTLLRLRPQHRYAVVEMGMNHAGEIAQLTALTRPTVALITNAGPAHLAGLGSVDAVARAKGEIFAGLDREGIAVLNRDDAFYPLWADLTRGHRQITFGWSDTADVSGVAEPQAGGVRLAYTVREVERTRHGTVDIPLLGRHNAHNALCAIAGALAVGATLEEATAGLVRMVPSPGRLQWRAGLGGAEVIDDTYNANPGSVVAAIEVLSELPGRRVLVLGDMFELGPEAVARHRDMGESARRAGIDEFWAIGPQAAEAAAAFGSDRTYEGPEALVAALRPRLVPGMTVLVKGSRSMRMERVVAGLAGVSPAEVH